MQRRRPSLVGAAFSVLLMAAGLPAAADEACNESIAREELAKLNSALHRPKAQEAMAAAKVDLADGDFDNEDNAKYLAAAAVFIQANDHLNAGYVDEACNILQKSKPLRDTVTAGE